MFAVELFVVFFSIFCWLITPVNDSQEIQEIQETQKPQDKKQTQSQNVKVQENQKVNDAEGEVDIIREEVLNLRFRELQKIASKLKIKQKEKRRTLSKDELLKRIIYILETERDRLQIALNELSIEQVLRN